MSVIEIKPDEFASSAFACHAYALVVRDAGEDFAQHLRDALGHIDDTGPRLIHTKVSSGAIAQLTVLEDAGFRVVDTNVLLQRALKAGQTLSGNSIVRFAEAHDRDAVTQLAASEFVYTRFHLDPMISNDAADRFKAAWAANFFEGKRGDQMVVAEMGGVLVGFVQLLRRDDVLTIDLIAVSSKHRRQKVAADLQVFSENANRDCATVRVGTQVANAAALACYEHLGFRTVDASYVLHYHKANNEKVNL